MVHGDLDMTTKKPTLAAALTTSQPTAGSTWRPPSRRNRRGWLVHLDPDRHRRLKVAAALNDLSLQALGEEAADLLLERYGV